MFDDPERYEHDGFYEDADYENEYIADDLPEKKRRKRKKQTALTDNDTDTEETELSEQARRQIAKEEQLIEELETDAEEHPQGAEHDAQKNTKKAACRPDGKDEKAAANDPIGKDFLEDITSPGGMADGTRIQERDISNISSTRRNPVLADIFCRLGYMEHQGSGFKKITESYRAAHNYRDELEPKFYSDASSFQVTLYNLNYGTDEKGAVGEEKVALEQEKVALEAKKVAFERSIAELKLNKPTKDNILSLFENFGYDVPFSRADVIELCGLAPSSAGKMLSKIKELDLIVSATEQGRGKYIFIEAKE